MNSLHLLQVLANIRHLNDKWIDCDWHLYCFYGWRSLCVVFFFPSFFCRQFCLLREQNDINGWWEHELFSTCVKFAEKFAAAEDHQHILRFAWCWMMKISATRQNYFGWSRIEKLMLVDCHKYLQSTKWWNARDDDRWASAGVCCLERCALTREYCLFTVSVSSFSRFGFSHGGSAMEFTSTCCFMQFHVCWKCSFRVWYARLGPFVLG